MRSRRAEHYNCIQGVELGRRSLQASRGGGFCVPVPTVQFGVSHRLMPAWVGRARRGPRDARMFSRARTVRGRSFPRVHATGLRACGGPGRRHVGRGEATDHRGEGGVRGAGFDVRAGRDLTGSGSVAALRGLFSCPCRRGVRLARGTGGETAPAGHDAAGTRGRWLLRWSGHAPKARPSCPMPLGPPAGAVRAARVGRAQGHPCQGPGRQGPRPRGCGGVLASTPARPPSAPRSAEGGRPARGAGVRPGRRGRYRGPLDRARLGPFPRAARTRPVKPLG